MRNIRIHHRLLPGLALFVWLAACDRAPSDTADTGSHWQTTADGIVVNVDNSGFRRVRLQAIDAGIVRVTATPQDDFSNLPNTLMVTAEAQGAAFQAEQRGDVVVLKTDGLAAEVSLETGAVQFKDAAGKVLLAEAERTLTPVTADPGTVDEDSFAIHQQFYRGADEAIYGLGQQQDGRVNYAGENVELTTHNIVITIPFLASSSRGYGVLWNNASVTRLGNPEPPQPLAAGFELHDADGERGGLTARYYDGDELKLERVEADLN